MTEDDKKQKMTSYRFKTNVFNHLKTKVDKTAYIEELIEEDIKRERQIYSINLEPFNESSRKRIKEMLITEGVSVKKGSVF